MTLALALSWRGDPKAFSGESGVCRLTSMVLQTGRIRAKTKTQSPGTSRR